MSLYVDKKSITPKQKLQLLKLCKVKEVVKNPVFQKFPKTYKLYKETPDDYIIPRTVAKIMNVHGKSFREKHSLKINKVKFSCSMPLYGKDNPDPKAENRDQESNVQLAVTSLKEKGYCFLNFSTGFGKSLSALHVIQRLKVTCLFLVKAVENQKQTYKSFKDASDARVHHYVGKKVPPNDAQIVVCGLIKACKLSTTYLSRFQFVIIDEADEAMAPSFFELLKKFCPDYFLGLSATMKKSTGLDKALYKYFGEKPDILVEFITKPNVTAVKVQTRFKPNIEYKTVNGEFQIDRHEMSRSLAVNNDRNRFICKFIKHHCTDGQVLILSPRTENIPILAEMATKYNKTSDFKTVGKSTIDKSVDVLVVGMMGAGRGFDCKCKYLFLLGTPINAIQNIGRLRDPNGTIFLFVDNDDRSELGFKRKSLPHLKKLKTKIYFCNDYSEPFQKMSIRGYDQTEFMEEEE